MFEEIEEKLILRMCGIIINYMHHVIICYFKYIIRIFYIIQLILVFKKISILNFQKLTTNKIDDNMNFL